MSNTLRRWIRIDQVPDYDGSFQLAHWSEEVVVTLQHFRLVEHFIHIDI